MGAAEQHRFSEPAERGVGIGAEDLGDPWLVEVDHGGRVLPCRGGFARCARSDQGYRGYLGDEFGDERIDQARPVDGFHDLTIPLSRKAGSRFSACQDPVHAQLGLLVLRVDSRSPSPCAASPPRRRSTVRRRSRRQIVAGCPQAVRAAAVTSLSSRMITARSVWLPAATRTGSGGRPRRRARRCRAGAGRARDGQYAAFPRAAQWALARRVGYGDQLDTGRMRPGS